MLNQSIATVLAALVGGLMAIVAGMIANIFTTRKEISREKRKELREILESMYNFTATINHLCRQATLGPSQMDEAVAEIPENLAQIGMRVRLYIPNLEDIYVKYNTKIGQITELILNLKNENISKEQYKEEVENSMKELMEFRKAIVEVLKKKGYSYFKPLKQNAQDQVL